jgi:hypothetical protein
MPSATKQSLLLFCGSLLLSYVLLPSTAYAQSDTADEEESEALFQIERIEVRGFGGLAGGEKYLTLPGVPNELTVDTAEDLIMDFSGNPAVDLGLRLNPEKDLQSGVQMGAQATFYLSEAFGFFLRGSLTQAEVVLTGRRGPTDPREEFDRANLNTFSGKVGAVFHIGKARKLPVRPYVNLAFGGLLNRFENIDDITALSFDLGGGATFGLTDSFRGQIGVDLQFYSWQTDEIALDKTMIIPQVTAGIIWRYDVPSFSNGSGGS